jgi:hypothetical protein
MLQWNMGVQEFLQDPHLISFRYIPQSGILLSMEKKETAICNNKDEPGERNA